MADLKELLGEAFKEDMTIEEIQTALADKELVDAKTVPQNAIDKKIFDKTASELSTVKKQLKELEKAKMTEEEQRAAAEREREEEFKALKTEKCRLLMEKEFVGAGIAKERYESLIESYPFDDAEKAVEYAQGISQLILDDRKATEKQVKETLLASTQKPQTQPAGGAATKEMFMQEYQKAQEAGDRVKMISIINQAAAKGIRI